MKEVAVIPRTGLDHGTPGLIFKVPNLPERFLPSYKVKLLQETYLGKRTKFNEEKHQYIAIIVDNEIVDIKIKEVRQYGNGLSN